jgi:multiple sugar transport system substrate-binding protein
MNMKKTILELVPIATLIASAAAMAQTDADAWLKGASKPYQGTTINVIGEALPPLDSLAKRSVEFTELTGITVNVEARDMDSVKQKVTADFVARTQIYDVFMNYFSWVAAMADNDWIVPLETFTSNKAITDPNFDLQRDISNQEWLNTMAAYKGKLYGVPFTVHTIFLYWRWDLYEHPEEKANFKAKYGYDLPSPPVTLDQLKDTAEFFTRKTGEKLGDEVLQHDSYGMTLAGKRHISTVYNWMNVLYAYDGQTVDSPGHFDYGPVIVNSEEAVKSLEYYKWLVDNTCPPGTVTYTWDEQLAAVQTGLATSALLWADAAYATSEDATQSGVVGKIAYSGTPIGTRKITNMNGWSLSIPKSSKNQEAAWLFLQWSQRKEIQALLMSNGTIALPDSAYTVPEVYKLTYAPTHYFFTHAKVLEVDGKPAFREEGQAWGLPKAYYEMPDPKTGNKEVSIFTMKAFPESLIVEDILGKYINESLAGGLTPKDALDQAAVELKQKIPNLQ